MQTEILQLHSAGKMRDRGALIVLEGCDGCGKSTQAELLLQRLTAAKFSAESLRFPDRTTTTGKLIDSYLKERSELPGGEAIHLLFNANHWEAMPKMAEQLASGTTLVLDRYAYSGIAYSAALRGLSMDWCRRTCDGMLAADLVFLLDLAPAVAAARPGYGVERYERVDMQRRVHDAYDRLLDHTWIKIDAAQRKETIADGMMAETLAVLAQIRQTSPRRCQMI